MSSRALRKAQREREEQAQLNKLKEEEESEDDTTARPAPSAKKSAFAMLNEAGEEDDTGDEAANADDADREEEAVSTTQTAVESRPKAPTKKKKKKKKAKTKTGASSGDAANHDDEGLDEIDKALKQLSTNGSSLPATTTAGTDEALDETSKLLAIEPTHLHSQNEMRRLFGRAALEQNDDEEQAEENGNGGANRRQQRHVQQVGLAQALRGQSGRGGGLAAMALRRNIFIQGKEDWPQATGGGLGMEVEEKRADGTILYRFVHNRAYQDVQGQFETAVESMDPNRLVVLLQHNPYHISTLLQVSEIAKQQGDHATSGGLLERALFSFGRAVHSTFAKSIAEGKARLEFARPENREFWLASWRYMQNLSMRATWRTVYEWAKLLLSLSPEEDPYSLWLVLDQYALRSRQDLDYLNISRNADFRKVHQDMPNVQFSQGLAEFRAGNKGKGQQALFTAIGKFPWVAARLVQEVGLDAPPAIWGKEARTEKEKLYSELYASRAKDIWITPETSALLLETSAAIPPETPSVTLNDDPIHPNEARHVILSDTPALIALVPRSYTSALTSVSDPLPPDDSYRSYLEESRLASVPDQLRELQDHESFFEQLFPNGDLPEMAGGYDGGGDGGEWIRERIRERGFEPEAVARRMQRMIGLRDRLIALVGRTEVDGPDAE